MQEFLNKVTPFFENLLGQNNASNIYTVNILWPMIEFGGKVRRQEIAGHADVGIEGDVHFGAMPLIGASVDMSILNLIIQLVATSTGLHPLGKLLREAKAIAKRGVNNDWVKASADIDIKLNVAGKIGGKVGWKAILGQEEWKPHGGSEMSGEVSFLSLIHI